MALVILGASGSGKTSFIKSHLVKSKPNDLSTVDIRSYRYHGLDIYDTPCLHKYDCFTNIIDKTTKISVSEVTCIVFFYEGRNQNKILLNLSNYSRERNITLIVYAPLKEFNDDSIFSVESKKELSNAIYDFVDGLNLSRSKISGISVLGITNVGKSTLINSLIGEGVLSVKDERHTTAENVRVSAKVGENVFEIYDTLGLENNTKGKVHALRGIIEKSVYCIVVCDIETFNFRVNGYIINILRKMKKNFTLVVNKCDLVNVTEIRKIFRFVKDRYFDLSPIMTNSSRADLKSFLSFIKTDDFKLSDNILSKMLKAENAKVLYAKGIKNNDFYTVKIFVKEEVNFNLIRIKKIIYEKFNIYNYHLNIEIVKYKNEKNKKRRSFGRSKEYSRSSERFSQEV